MYPVRRSARPAAASGGLRPGSPDELARKGRSRAAQICGSSGLSSLTQKEIGTYEYTSNSRIAYMYRYLQYQVIYRIYIYIILYLIPYW